MQGGHTPADMARARAHNRKVLEASKRADYTPRCITCGMSKKPVGRSVGLYAANSFCDHECSGYYDDPAPTPYWSAEDEREMRAFLARAET